jgi:tRNA-dihydrouridine synthase 3
MVLALLRCRFTHDIPAYLSQKPRDIYFPPASSISLEPPYVTLPTVTASAAPVDPTTPTSTSTSDIAPPSSAPPLLPAPPPQLQDPTISIDFTTTCPVFQETGECRHGLKCRFLGGHADQITTEDGSASTSIKLKVDEDLKAVTVLSSKELNFSGPENLALLRKKKVSPFSPWILYTCTYAYVYEYELC